MKKYLLLILITPIVIFAQFGSGGTTKRIDEIQNESQSNIILNPTTEVQINYFGGSKALQSNATKGIEESAVTNTELGFLTGSTENVQTSLDSKVDLTTDQSISGIKTFTGQYVATSTVNGMRPCPVMTEIQRDAIATPNEGDCIVNSTTNELNFYLAAAWGQVGGGSVGTNTGDVLAYNSVSGKYEPVAAGTQDQILTVDTVETLNVKFKDAPKSNGVEYISNGDIETNLNGYATYLDAAGTIPVDGTGGTAISTIARNLIVPLMDTAHLLFAKDAVNRQGEGFSYDFTIDTAQKAKKLIISFEYDASDANYADNDIGIFIYDVTNAKLIRINGEDLKGGKGTHYAQFQTAPDSLSYRLIIHVASTNATAYNVYFDNISVGPQIITHGAISVYLGSLTTTGSWNGTTYSGKYWREGEFLKGVVNLTLSSAPTATDLLIDLPSGYVMDTSKLAGGTSVRGVIKSSGTIYENAGNNWDIHALYNSTTNIRLMVDSVTTALSNPVNITTPFTVGASDIVTIEYEVPIQGWASTAKMSSDFSGRDIIVRGAGNSSSVITADTERIDFTLVEDTTGSWTTTDNGTDTFTAPETGYYNADGLIRINAPGASIILRFLKNNVADKSITSSINAQTIMFRGSIKLNKGDTLSIVSNTTITLQNSNLLHHITIQKLASAQTMLENERVYARYTSNNGQSFTNGSVLEFEDLDEDDTNSYNPVNGNFIVPVTGAYFVAASGEVASQSWVASNGVSLNVQVNSVIQASGNTRLSGGVQIVFSQVTAILNVNKGDIIRISAGTSINTTLTTTSTRNTLTIARIK